MSSSRYSPERVDALCTELALPSSIRILPIRHRDTPLGVAPGDSRFCSRSDPYTVLYAAQDLATAFLETVVRDRLTHSRKRRIAVEEVTQRSWTSVSSTAGSRLRLLDLRGNGCVRLGAPTDAVNARNHAAGRALGRTIHAEHPEVDGILFASRLTGSDAYAIFDRAVDSLQATPALPLAEHPKLPLVLLANDIQLETP